MTTLLDAVNAVGKRARFLDENTELVSLSNTAKQTFIDITIQAWNEATVELFDVTHRGVPSEVKSATITLVASTRSYSLATDILSIRWPMHDETNGRYIHEWKGTFESLVHVQVHPDSQTGTPCYGMVSPIDGTLYLDKIPTSSEAGYVYTYHYDKEILLSSATDTMPMSDTAYHMLIPAVAEKVRRDKDAAFDGAFWAKQMGLASRAILRSQRSGKYFG